MRAHAQHRRARRGTCTHAAAIERPRLGGCLQRRKRQVSRVAAAKSAGLSQPQSPGLLLDQGAATGQLSPTGTPQGHARWRFQKRGAAHLRKGALPWPQPRGCNRCGPPPPCCPVTHRRFAGRHPCRPQQPMWPRARACTPRSRRPLQLQRAAAPPPPSGWRQRLAAARCGSDLCRPPLQQHPRPRDHQRRPNRGTQRCLHPGARRAERLQSGLVHEARGRRHLRTPPQSGSVAPRPALLQHQSADTHCTDHTW
mmetsp:Transcript_56798/g.176492  ORF Transcript_56798/g.176492 Transcript_56798/m.176492 type:complete len:254 (+) Transcript_56798:1247-2008(+)